MDSGDRILRNVAGLGSAGTTPCNADLLLAMSHVPPLIGFGTRDKRWDTGQTMLWLLCGCWRRHGGSGVRLG